MDERNMTDDEISMFYHSGLDWLNSFVDMVPEGDSLAHIGNENSGRYPRGSGENPWQHVPHALKRVFGFSKGASNKEGPTSDDLNMDSKSKGRSKFSFDRSKKPKDMTDEELNEAINELEVQISRMRREDTYCNLQAELHHLYKKGKETAIGRTLKKGASAFLEVNKTILAKHGRNILDYAFGTMVNKIIGANVTSPGAKVTSDTKPKSSPESGTPPPPPAATADSSSATKFNWADEMVRGWRAAGGRDPGSGSGRRKKKKGRRGGGGGA